MLDIETATLVRSIRGAPASILVALLITRRSITNKELQVITGYTDKPIATALCVLETLGFIQDNGRSNGWSFPHSRQLELFGSLPLPPPSLSPGRDSVSSWLDRAGVTANSKKMGELLAADFTVGYVRSWVLEFEWWRRESQLRPGQAIDGRRRFSIGTLIRILQDRDPAPAERCSACLTRLPCYCDVVVR